MAALLVAMRNGTSNNVIEGRNNNNTYQGPGNMEYGRPDSNVYKSRRGGRRGCGGRRREQQQVRKFFQLLMRQQRLMLP